MRSLDLILFAIDENGVKVRDAQASYSIDSNYDLKLETNSASVLRTICRRSALKTILNPSKEVRVDQTILRFFELTSYHCIYL